MRAARVFVVALLVLGLLSLVSAASGASAPESCPPEFHLHELHDHHDGDEEHMHVGNSFDQNGDGLVCVKHVSQDGAIHVHVDNVLPGG